MGEAFPLAEIRVVSANDVGMPRVRRLPDGCSSVDADRGRRRCEGLAWRPPYGARRSFTGRICSCAATSTSHRSRWSLRVFIPRVTLLAYGIDAWAPSLRLRRAARRLDQVLAISRYTAARMAEWGVERERLRIVPVTVDGETFRRVRSPRAAGGPVLLTVARLDTGERSKGVDLVIAEMPALRARFPGLRYVIGGTGDDIPRLMALAQRLGVADAVDFIGAISEQELPERFSTADVFVMPSRKEGFGIVFIESLTCGTPVIACGLEGSRDALLDGRVGLLIDPDEHGALRSAIEQVLSRSCPSRLLDPARLRRETLDAFGTDTFRRLLRDALEPELVE